MKKYVSLFMIALLFCVAVSVGCGGGGGAAIMTLLTLSRPRV